MKKSSLILILNLFLLQGCTLFGGGGDNAQNTSPPSNPTPGNQQKTPDNSTNENTEESDILGEPGDENTSNGVPVARGLIPSINPKSREAKVIKGRNDPFSLVEVTPIVNDPSVFSPKSNSDTTEDTNTNSESGIPSQLETPPEPVEDPYFKPESSSLKYCNIEDNEKGNDPLFAKTKEARSVLVSGVVSLPGEEVAIIKTSEYDYTYKVSEGASLYGGQVLVAQIDSDANPPFVILEQYGREVIRSVGDEPDELLEAPLGPDGFGRIRNVVLLSIQFQGLETSNGRLEGVLCNDNDENIRIDSIEIQVEDKETSEVINSLSINFGTSYLLKPGQKGIVDGRLTGGFGDPLRGRKKEEVNFIMLDWG